MRLFRLVRSQSATVAPLPSSPIVGLSPADSGRAPAVTAPANGKATGVSGANDPPSNGKRRSGIASAASFATRRVAAIVNSLEKSLEERKDEPKRKKYGGATTSTRYLHGIAKREQELKDEEEKERELEEFRSAKENLRRALKEPEKGTLRPARRAETLTPEALGRMVRSFGREVNINNNTIIAPSIVEKKKKEDKKALLETLPEEITVPALPEAKLRKAKKYSGARTTSSIFDIKERVIDRIEEEPRTPEVGRKVMEAKEEEAEKEAREERRRHLVGFTHRKSHLSLTSQLSGSASFYLIGHRGRGGGRYDESTLGSESEAGRVFSDDDDRGSISTDLTSVSRQHEKMMQRKRRQQRQYHRRPSRASSFSSITESSMSLHVETVTLNMDSVSFLGISIVGQSSARGDNGIYVANVMKGGAVALDGRIEPGDMILQVNDTAFDNFNNDQAVDVLREAVEKKGTITLTVAKSLDTQPRSGYTIPRHNAYNARIRDEPVRPIDTNAWIAHTNQMRCMPSIIEGSEGAPTPLPGDPHPHHHRPATSSSATSTGSGQNTVVGGGGNGIPRVDVHTDKRKVVEVMVRPGSGLDIKNRTWLKIPIPMSFLGSDLVDWLMEHVHGLNEKKEARKYAEELLRQRLIAHVVNKRTFNDNCYYVLGEQCADFARYGDLPKGVGMIHSTGGNGPQPTWQLMNGGGSMVSGYASMPMSPLPMFHAQAAMMAARQGEGSQISDGSGSSEAKRSLRPTVILPPAPASSRLDEQVSQEMGASRQSFRMAMTHPYGDTIFIDNL